MKYNMAFTIGLILSSFYIGYFLTQLPGGYLAGRFGCRYVFGIGVFMTAVLTLLTRLAAEIHIAALVVLRILEGCFEVSMILSGMVQFSVVLVLPKLPVKLVPPKLPVKNDPPKLLVKNGPP